MPHSPIGESHEDVVREEIERDPAFASAYEETQFEAQAALALAEMREQRQLTQQALAQAAGTSQPMINRIEKAGQIPTITTLWKLVRALDAEATIRPEGIAIQPAHSLVNIYSSATTLSATNMWGESAVVGPYPPRWWAVEPSNSVHINLYNPIAVSPWPLYTQQAPQEATATPESPVAANLRRLFPSPSNGEAMASEQRTPMPRFGYQRDWENAGSVAGGQ